MPDMIRFDEKYSKNCVNCNNVFYKNYNTSLSEWFGCNRRPNGTLYCSKNCFYEKKIGATPYNKGITGIYKWTENKRILIINKWHNKRQESKNVKFSGAKWNNTKKYALKRDDYTCQLCFIKAPDIVVVDHILPKSIRKDLMYNIENCITMCPNCHAYKTIHDRELIKNHKKNQTTTIANA